MNFIALDFETANAKLPPCSVGLVVVENSIIKEEFYTFMTALQKG